MASKSHLVGLKFEWNSNERVIDDFDFQLLDNLQPHPNIRFLTINGFRGNRFPSWLLGQNSLKHLTALRLIYCTNVEEISFFYESVPSCKLLYLCGLNNLKEMPHLHPNLTTLVIQMVPLLTYFSENDLKEERKQFMLEAVNQITEYVKLRCDQQLPESFEDSIRRDLQLTKLRLKATPEICMTSSKCENLYPDVAKIDPRNKDYTCDRLMDAWNMCMLWHIETMLSKIEESKLILPPSLTKLWILSCSITTYALSASIQCLVSLSELWLCEIHTITSLPSEEALCDLKNLRSFWVERCYLLSSLGGIRALTSLTEFKLEYCLNLNSSNGQLPSSLETLKFKECACVDAILDQSDLPLLRVLVVEEYLNVGCFREKHDKRVLHVGRAPCLKELTIIGWKGSLEGLNSLTSLNKLEVIPHRSFSTGNCSIQNVSVEVYNPLLLKQLSDETISSTEILSIVSFEGESINDEVFLSFTSLKCLVLEDCNITHLPVHLKDLTSLRGLYLNCPKLSEVEYLPKNLHSLLIKNNPTLAKKFHCHNDGSYQVVGDEGNTYLTFPTEGQTMPGPFQPIQQASTSQSAQQVAANPLEGLTRRFLRLLSN
ncbi:Rp1-like protein [Rhynchospora pubera]|uniref:Rp1-like protein n=1 Tax=Rhynchospora pubera TaxID=906938 RepID=A0AAV8DNI0_9POAL|nr:Rp1-like protein [Rhynchospora pubera]